jgi:hypothetical protein
MGYSTKIQIIERSNNTRQYYFICPAPLAQAMEFLKGEEIDWAIEDRDTIVIRRVQKTESKLRSKKHAK